MRAIVLAMGLALAVSMTGTGSPKATASRAACPQPAERVQEPNSSAVYLIDPQGFLYWIPTETEYFDLWDSWDGIAVYPNLFAQCYERGDARTMGNAHLAKTGSLPEVYIWDDQIAIGGAYRRITSEAIFDKYKFNWGRIRVQESVSPVASEWPWNN